MGVGTMFWKLFKNKKPTKNGWYQCTVEVPNQQRYVMDLYWDNKSQKFKDNRRQNGGDDSRDREHGIPFCG